MKVVTFTELRRNLARILDGATDDHDPVIVTRRNGKTVVVMSLEDFGSHEATRHLEASPANAERLRESFAELDRGEGIAVEFDEEAGVFRPIEAVRQAAE